MDEVCRQYFGYFKDSGGEDQIIFKDLFPNRGPVSVQKLLDIAVFHVHLQKSYYLLEFNVCGRRYN